MRVQFVLHSNYSFFVRGIIAQYENEEKQKAKEGPSYLGDIRIKIFCLVKAKCQRLFIDEAEIRK